MPNKAFIKDNQNDTFTVQLFYHTKVRELLNKIEGNVYDAEHRVFNIPKRSIEHLIDGLLNLNIDVQEVEELPDQKIVPKIAYIKANDEDDDLMEVLVKYSPKMIQVFKDLEMKYNHENGSWMINKSGRDKIFHLLPF